jgi:hypothetical protein
MSRLITCAWMDTSSADTGSSHTISRGRTDSARAMPSRWRCPPENSYGYFTICSARRPTRSNRWVARRRTSVAGSDS